MDVKFKDSIGYKPLSKHNVQSQQKKKKKLTMTASEIISHRLYF